ncbi:MAG TPA: winged helix-turn-helix domain-containing protein [Candidatus Thermoplasmatota archaeon]|nr:winged helix-turn-helix domain-containing protein [Candidatus Thermoplasmatota archaeon]
MFGDAPSARILDFLAEHAEFDYNISELAKHSGVARPTVYKVVADFLKKGLLVETRKVGNSQLYQLNLESEVVQQLVEVGPALQPSQPKTRARLPARRGGAWNR